MVEALATVIPTSVALSLLGFGGHNEQPLIPTPKNFALIALAVLVLGPISEAVCGFLIWLMLLAGSGTVLSGYLFLRTKRGRVAESQ